MISHLVPYVAVALDQARTVASELEGDDRVIFYAELVRQLEDFLPPYLRRVAPVLNPNPNHTPPGEPPLSAMERALGCQHGRHPDECAACRNGGGR